MFNRAPPKYILSEEQRRMYASEKLVNFRWISKILATRSPRVLTDADLAPIELSEELAEIGQFAEVAYSIVPIEFIFRNIGILLEPAFPLEGYYALRDSVLVSSFKGRVANLPAYVVYRPSKKQLVVAISGTASLKLAYHDLRAIKVRHASGRGFVHSGFWSMYQGIKGPTLDAISKGLQEYDVDGLVVTGHSMGGSIAYLLCIDLLAFNNSLWPRLPNLKIAVFGVPRSGNSELVAYWQELIERNRRVNGQKTLEEYSVKAYNDGVPALPPSKLGYRHFAREPIYLTEERLYNIPPEESEHALFAVSVQDTGNGHAPKYPRGGHNYYNGRDLEMIARRVALLDQAAPEKSQWEERYKRLIERRRT